MYVLGPWDLRLPLEEEELRPKWKDLSWVLQNLSFMDFSAALGQRQSVSQKGRNVPILGHCGLSYLISQNFLKILGCNNELRVHSFLDGFLQTSYPATPDEGCEERSDLERYFPVI